MTSRSEGGAGTGLISPRASPAIGRSSGEPTYRSTRWSNSTISTSPTGRCGRMSASSLSTPPALITGRRARTRRGVESAPEQLAVTGGAGFIGASRRSARRGRGRSGRDRRPQRWPRREPFDAVAAGAELEAGTILVEEFLQSRLSGADVVIHMACDNLRASLGNPKRTHEINATGTLVTALAAVKAAVKRFAYVSASEAYGSGCRRPHERVTSTAADNRLRVEQVASRADRPGMLAHLQPARDVIRPFNAYVAAGACRGHQRRGDTEVRIPITAVQRPVIFGVCTQTRISPGSRRPRRNPPGRQSATNWSAAVNVAHGTGVSIRDVCEILLEILGASELEPASFDERSGDVLHHWADTTKPTSPTGCAPDPDRQGPSATMASATEQRTSAEGVAGVGPQLVATRYQRRLRGWAPDHRRRSRRLHRQRRHPGCAGAGATVEAFCAKEPCACAMSPSTPGSRSPSWLSGGTRAGSLDSSRHCPAVTPSS